MPTPDPVLAARLGARRIADPVAAPHRLARFADRWCCATGEPWDPALCEPYGLCCVTGKPWNPSTCSHEEAS